VRPINLLPARYQRARASGDRPGIGYAAIGILAVLLLMIVLYVTTNNGINDAREKTATAQVEQQAAQARVGQLQAFGNFQQLKASREDAVKRVATARFDYERLMRETALLLPKNTYLTSLNAGTGGGTASTSGASGTTTSTGPSVTIAGCSPSHPDVATAIVRLRKLHNVTDVNLQNSTKAGASTSGTTAACAVQWGAVLTFNPETAPTVPEPVPARLGGGQ
jgi:Tfp pilus assembly protein PilN